MFDFYIPAFGQTEIEIGKLMVSSYDQCILNYGILCAY